MHRASTRLDRLEQQLEPPQKVHVTWGVEGGPELVFEPGTHVLEIYWDGSAKEYIVGESASDASP